MCYLKFATSNQYLSHVLLLIQCKAVCNCQVVSIGFLRTSKFLVPCSLFKSPSYFEIPCSLFPVQISFILRNSMFLVPCSNLLITSIFLAPYSLFTLLHTCSAQQLHISQSFLSCILHIPPRYPFGIFVMFQCIGDALFPDDMQHRVG